jgi:transposase
MQLQSAASPDQPRGLGKMTSVIIDREIGDWNRFSNRRQIASYTGLCPGEYASGNTRVQSCVTKHGNPRLRAALVELAWRLVRFQPNYKPIVKWRATLAKGALATGAARKKANRSRGAPVGRRSVENQNRPTQRRRVRINQLMSSGGTERRCEPHWH